MDLEINDRVEVIDENLFGHVIFIDENRITIECPDGFEYIYAKSQVFKVNNEHVLLKFVDLNPSETAPLSNVASVIQSKIGKQRYTDARSEYLKGLREKTSIKVNDKNWAKIKEELAETKWLLKIQDFRPAWFAV